MDEDPREVMEWRWAVKSMMCAYRLYSFFFFFFFQAEDGIRDYKVTGVQTCALPISVLTQVPAASSPDPAAARAGRRPVCLDAATGYVDTPVYDYRELRAGHVLNEIGRASCRERV